MVSLGSSVASYKAGFMVLHAGSLQYDIPIEYWGGNLYHGYSNEDLKRIRGELLESAIKKGCGNGGRSWTEFIFTKEV